MKNITYWGTSVVCFIIYFQVFKLIWKAVPYNIITDMMTLFIVVVVLVPLSVISADKILKYIKRN